MKIRKFLSLVLILVFALVLVSCSSSTDDTVTYTPSDVSNPTEVVKTGTYNNLNFSVTKEDVYKSVRANGGMPLLLQEIDEILLSDTISKVTTGSKEYVSRYNRLIYSTDDEVAINALSNEEKATDLEEYNKTMTIMGLTTTAEQENYIKLLAARDLYTISWLKNEQNNTKSDYYVTQATLSSYYDSSYYTNDAKAIIINFSSVNDYRSTIKSLNLVTYNSELRVYTGTDPIDNVAQINLNDTNTRAFADTAEALSYFVQIYNLVYGSYKTPATQASVYTEDAFNYDFLTLKSNASSLASYVFNMVKDEYTYAPYKSTVSYGTVYSLIYRLDGEARTAYEDLDATTKEAVADQYYHSLIETSSYVTTALTALRSSKNIKFYDRYFALDYAASYDTTYTTTGIKGDSAILVTLDNISITADDLYEYGTGRDAEYYILYASITAIEQTLASYTLLYGNERSLDNNASLRYISYYDTVKSQITTNYTEATYESKEKYIYKTFGYTSIEDAVKYYYCMNDLKTMTVYENLFDVSEVTSDDYGTYNVASFKSSLSTTASAYINKIFTDYYNKYYDLYPYQINVTTDFDGDFKADSYYNIPASIKAAYDTAVADLYNTIKTEVIDKSSTVSELTTNMSQFIIDYNASLRTGKYSEYKQLGFRLTYSAVTTTVSSSTVSPTYYNYVSTATDEMNAAYLAVYNKIIASSYNDIYTYVDTIITDKNGAHFIAAKEGDGGQTKPAFRYYASSDSSKVYNVSSYNSDSDAPTMVQLANAMYVAFYGTVLTDSSTAKDTYNISSYPKSFPSAVDLDSFTSALTNYFYSENFVNAFYCNILGYTEFASIYDYFLNASVK